MIITIDDLAMGRKSIFVPSSDAIAQCTLSVFVIFYPVSGNFLILIFHYKTVDIFANTLSHRQKRLKKYIVKPEEKFPKPYIVQWLHRFPHYQQDAVLIPSLAAAH